MDNKRQMFVQLNFTATTTGGEVKELAIKRMINEQGKSEYFINAMPMLLEDFIHKITSDYQLNLNNFCVYQGKLEELIFPQTSEGDIPKSENRLVAIFEELSGSSIYRHECDNFKLQLQKCNDSIKKDSENLQQLRLEKIKQKGLKEFAEKMDDCLKE